MIMCMAIRLTPVWMCLFFHCPYGRWPTSVECLARVKDYGFSVSSFKSNRLVLLTHMFVHASDEHLAGNLLLLSSSLLELGGGRFPASTVDHNVWKSVKETAGSFVVFIAGGVSGVTGQLLFNYMRLKWQRWKGALSLKPFTSCFYDKGTGLFPTVKSRFDRWLGQVTYNVGKHRVDSAVMCGASAGGYAIHGFEAARTGNWIAVWIAAGMEVLRLSADALGGRSSTGLGAWWRVGETVGHAAHLSGLGTGVLLGWLWRQRRERERRLGHRRHFW